LLGVSPAIFATFIFAFDCVYRMHAWAAKSARWKGIGMHRRLMKAFENETAFAIGVICLGLCSLAMLLAAFFVG
jgi:hypothetical protein